MVRNRPRSDIPLNLPTTNVVRRAEDFLKKPTTLSVHFQRFKRQVVPRFYSTLKELLSTPARL